MKLRIKGNSLRYRLTKSEVARLWLEGALEERAAFSGNTLVYAIVRVESDVLTADFVKNRIVLHMPKTMIDELYHTDQVGFDNDAGPVRLLVEKDFVCLDNTEEDQSDHYPNPSSTC